MKVIKNHFQDSIQRLTATEIEYELFVCTCTLAYTHNCVYIAGRHSSNTYDFNYTHVRNLRTYICGRSCFVVLVLVVVVAAVTTTFKLLYAFSTKLSSVLVRLTPSTHIYHSYTYAARCRQRHKVKLFLSIPCSVQFSVEYMPLVR